MASNSVCSQGWPWTSWASYLHLPSAGLAWALLIWSWAWTQGFMDTRQKLSHLFYILSPSFACLLAFPVLQSKPKGLYLLSKFSLSYQGSKSQTLVKTTSAHQSVHPCRKKKKKAGINIIILYLYFSLYFCRSPFTYSSENQQLVWIKV